MAVLLASSPPASAQMTGNPLFDISQGLASKITGLDLGGVQFGLPELGGLIMRTLIAIADLMVPDWLVEQPLKLVQWIVAAPDWTSGFAGVNGLQSTLRWFGTGLLGVGITAQGVAVMVGQRSADEVVRAVAVAVAGLAFFTWGWDTATALLNTITASLLDTPAVKGGISAMLGFTAGTAFLASGTIFAPLLVICAGLALLGLVAAKAALILLSAIVYILGPFVFAIGVWPAGRTAMRMWSTAATAVFAIPFLWSLLFAVSGVLIKDAAASGASLVEGGGAFGAFMSSVLLAVTAVITLYIAIKLGTSIFGMIRTLPMIGGVGGGGSGGGAPSARGVLDRAQGAASGGGGSKSPVSASAELGRLGQTLAGATGMSGAMQTIRSQAGQMASTIPGASHPAVQQAAGVAKGLATEGVWGPMERRAEARNAGGPDAGPATAPGAKPAPAGTASAGTTNGAASNAGGAAATAAAVAAPPAGATAAGVAGNAAANGAGSATADTGATAPPVPVSSPAGNGAPASESPAPSPTPPSAGRDGLDAVAAPAPPSTAPAAPPASSTPAAPTPAAAPTSNGASTAPVASAPAATQASARHVNTPAAAPTPAPQQPSQPSQRENDPTPRRQARDSDR